MQALLAHAVLNRKVRAIGKAGRFNVYRNNYRITLCNAMRTTFPAIEKLVGDEYFSALAIEFAERHPPRSPIMAKYGNDFADFLAGFGPLGDYPYLADVARIEFARVHAYHAADVEPFLLHDEVSIIEALDVPATLHPSVTIIASKQPALSIWRTQVEQAFSEPDSWESETGLVWRRDDRVTERLVSTSELRLLDHFSRDAVFSELLQDFTDRDAAEALISHFIEFAASGIIVPASPPLEGEIG